MSQKREISQDRVSSIRIEGPKTTKVTPPDDPKVPAIATIAFLLLFSLAGAALFLMRYPVFTEGALARVL